ncbi:MAG: hypothetical protein WD766_03850 [Gemmatimonadota bacterium]
MVVIDATTLLLFVDPNAAGPRDANGAPVQNARRRIEYLITELDRKRTKVVIPTPALSEVLVRSGLAESQRVVELLDKLAVFVIEPFDQRAAIEVAQMLRTESAQSQRRAKRGGAETWAKVKYDRQIVAIAKVVGAAAVYSDDNDVYGLCGRLKIPAYRTADLPLPPENLQQSIFDVLERHEQPEKDASDTEARSET